MNPFDIVAPGDLEETINRISLITVLAASVLLVILVLLAMKVVKNKKKKMWKAPVFFAILIVVVGTTLTISGSTVYLNIKSATGGPIHWHADFEVWACGNELELRDPIGALSNKIGTATYHEHDDKRIHLEGVPVSLPEDASLGKFMNVVGGSVSKNEMVVPLNDGKLFETDKGDEDGDGAGAPYSEQVDPFLSTTKDGKVATFVNGQKCGNEASEVQVFVYKFNEKDKTYSQTKLDDPANYAISGHSEVPPGDCVIFEFSPPKDRTNKLCKQYGVRDKIKCERFGVPDNERKICENTEMR
jgi:hypothetical protein